ncbi:serine/threonine-protein kinase [Marinobacter sp.]|uniref:serine/threonine-protein kinase n=1 Tax=Marinobacter sp. TaxID=50741 RepID=UPI003A8F4336
MESKSSKHKWLDKTLNQRYRIEALIASGGMSDVYRAVDLQLEQAGAADCKVALKILKHDMLTQDGVLGVLARETAKTKSLSHPNIIRVQDLQQDGDTCFMVMELLEGEPLTRMIQRSRPSGLKWKGVKEIVTQIVSALKYAHANNVVHADLKPSNIFFTRNGQIKLLDFGVSRVLSDPLQENFLHPGLDETSIYGYTPAYTLPEIAKGEQPTGEGDIYALACICYELLSSKHPFNRQSPSQKERQSAKLKRPGNLPLKTWRTLKQQLLGAPQQLSIQKTENALKPTPWLAVGQTVVTTAAITAGIIAWYTGTAESAKARLTAQTLTEQRQHSLALKDLPAEQLLQQLPGMSELDQAGLLKLQQTPLVNHFLSRIDKALEPNEENGLPNIVQALSVLESATALFPRDGELLSVQNRIENRQKTLQSALANEIQSTLEQGNYKAAKSANALVKLGSNLEFLGDKPPKPSQAAVNEYLSQVDSAFKAFDAPKQAQLLTIGNRFFAQSPETSDQRIALEKLGEAAKELAQYQDSQAAEGDQVFPSGAALVFYAQKFETWPVTIKNARSSRQLDAVYEDIQALKKVVPENFEKIVTAEKRLAEAYLSQADILLARNQTSRAQPLVKRATTLMR